MLAGPTPAHTYSPDIDLIANARLDLRLAQRLAGMDVVTPDPNPDPKPDPNSDPNPDPLPGDERKLFLPLILR